jgi:putative nucleotidyltransferase with HDIG domain
MDFSLRLSRALEPVLPYEPGLLAHCRRVAALASEVARTLKIDVASQRALIQAAFFHHCSFELWNTGSLEKLLTDICGPAWQLLPGPRESFAGSLSSEVRTVLLAFQISPPATAEPESLRLWEILEACNIFDEELETIPRHGKSVVQILDDLETTAQSGWWDPRIITALRSLPHAQKQDLLAVSKTLPVFPAVLIKLSALTSNPDVNFSTLEKLAGLDPVLAGQVIRAANSPLYGASCRITNLRQAISFIGLETTRKILIGASLRPLFASSASRHLWTHSVRMAEVAEGLAQISGRVNPETAFLAGLVHDIGRLVIQRLPVTYAAAHVGLMELGYAPVFADLLVCRADHGQIGAELLQEWNFSGVIVEGVRFHHWPNLCSSELATLLYAAEFHTASEEDLPSWTQLERALKMMAISLDDLQRVPNGSGALDALLGAA